MSSLGSSDTLPGDAAHLLAQDAGLARGVLRLVIERDGELVSRAWGRRLLGDVNSTIRKTTVIWPHKILVADMATLAANPAKVGSRP